MKTIDKYAGECGVKVSIVYNLVPLLTAKTYYVRNGWNLITVKPMRPSFTKVLQLWGDYRSSPCKQSLCRNKTRRHDAKIWLIIVYSWVKSVLNFRYAHNSTAIPTIFSVLSIDQSNFQIPLLIITIIIIIVIIVQEMIFLQAMIYFTKSLVYDLLSKPYLNRTSTAINVAYQRPEYFVMLQFKQNFGVWKKSLGPVVWKPINANLRSKVI